MSLIKEHLRLSLNNNVLSHPNSFKNTYILKQLELNLLKIASSKEYNLNKIKEI